MKKFFPIIAPIFAILVVVVFSGQYRSTRPVRQVKPQPAPAATTSPVLASSHPDRGGSHEIDKTQPSSNAGEMPLLVLKPDDMQWPEKDDPTAPISITLLGDRNKNELYVTRTFIPKGKKIIPHVHADARTVVVLSGTYYYGLGETFDESKLVALPRGTFLTEPAGVPHYNWAKDGDVVVQTTAIGPSGTRVIPDKIAEQPPQ